MQRSLRISIAAAALALASPALATNGMRMIGFGPVQDSMGGVSAAAPLDAATVVTNPAGMSSLSTRVDLSGTAFSPSVDYDAQWTPNGSSLFSAAQSSDRPTDFIPTLAAVYRAQDKLTLGVAALGTAGMGVDYSSGSAGLFGARTFTSYSALRVAPGAAYRVTDALSVGVAANVQYAMMSYEAGGMPKRDTAGALGIGATVGATLAVTQSVTLGAAWESRSYFQDFEFDIPAHTTPRGQSVPGGVEKLAFDQPQIATVGAAVRPASGLLVAADVQWINWSATSGKNMPAFQTDQAATGYMPWNMDWQDQIVLKVGAEYAVTRGLKVRAGYDYGKTPLSADRAFENVAFPAIAEHHITLGAGYDVGKLTVNASALYSPEAKLDGANAVEQGILAYESRMSQLSFDLGLSYRF